MTKISLLRELFEEIGDTRIQEIFLASGGSGEFELVIDQDRRSGRFITIETDIEKKYVIVSSNNNEGRNSTLAQFIPTVFSKYILDDTEKLKSIGIYLLPNRSITTKYNIFICRLSKNCGISIYNEHEFFPHPIVGFSDFQEFKNARDNNSDRNSHNKSSYFSEENDRVEVFGKVFGANGKETALLTFALSYISSKEVWLYQVFENNTRGLSGPDLKALIQVGVKIKDNINEFQVDEKESPDKPELELRNTPKFHYNLLKKFDNKKCYLCECDIVGMIIGAHIHRVADIKRDASLTNEEKSSQIVDGDNGFWLCADHDKLFELGLIYFQQKELKLSRKLSDLQIDFVEGLTGNKIISDEHYNDKVERYIELHLNRTQV